MSELITIETTSLSQTSSFQLSDIVNTITALKDNASENIVKTVEQLAGKEKSKEQSLGNFVQEIAGNLNLSNIKEQRKLTGISKAISESKTTIIKALRSRKKFLDADGKALLEIIQETESFFNELRDIISAPVTQYKADMEAIQQAIDEKIAKITFFQKTIDESGFYMQGMPVLTLKAKIDSLRKTQITKEDYGDKEELAKEELAKSIQFLEDKVTEEESRIAAQQKEEIDHLIKRLTNYRVPFENGGSVLTNMSSESVKDLSNKLNQIEVTQEIYGQQYDLAVDEKTKSLDYLGELYNQILLKEEEAKNLDAEKEKQAKEQLLLDNIEKIKSYQLHWKKQPRFADTAEDIAGVMHMISTLNAVKNKLNGVDFTKYGRFQTQCRTAVTASLDQNDINLAELSKLNTELQKQARIEQSKIDFDSKVQIRTNTVEEIQNIINSIDNIRYSEDIEAHVQQKKIDLAMALNAAKTKQAEEVKANMQNNKKWSEMLVAVRESILNNQEAVKQKIIAEDVEYDALDPTSREEYLKKRIMTPQECHFAAKALVQGKKYGVKINGLD